MTIKEKVTRVRKVPKVKKSLRLSVDMLAVLEKKAKKSGKPFSEMVRRAVVAQYIKPTRTKDK